MNQKKAKALRRECIDMPRMTQSVPYPIYQREFDKMLNRYIMRQSGNRPKSIPVSHYRNAKKHYRGSVDAAIRAAARHAETMEAIGVYKLK